MQESIRKQLRPGLLFLSVLGNVTIGMGISLFKISNFGNDPYNAMTMALGNLFGIPYMHFFVLQSLLLFIIPLLMGREYIGAGTLVNMFFVGYFTTFFLMLWNFLHFQPVSLAVRLLCMVLGVIVSSLGLSLYQSADVGISPFDALPMIMEKRFPRISYAVWRIIFDTTCTIVAYWAGGLVGIGALCCMFGLGPVVTFFNRWFVRAWAEKWRK